MEHGTRELGAKTNDDRRDGERNVGIMWQFSQFDEGREEEGGNCAFASPTANRISEHREVDWK